MEGGNGNEKNLPLEPRSGSISVAVGFNPRKRKRTELRIRRQANKTLRRWHNPTDAAKTLPWMDSALGVHAGIRNVNLRKIEDMSRWSLSPALVLRRSQPPYWVADEVRKRKKRTMSA